MVDTPCLTDEALAALIEGKLSPQELKRLHHHAAECSPCHTDLAAIVQGGLDLTPMESQQLPPTASVEPPWDSPGPREPGWTPPAVFAKFHLRAYLGKGAMGVVYLADDTSLGRQVAVKFIAAPQPNDRARQRFKTEARAIARLKHPNVVTLFDDGEIAGHPYLVYENIEGTSLEKRDSALPWRKVLHLGMGLASGLAAAHKAGVLHRDIKPANIMLTPSGEVKLLDFGLAELVEGDEGASLHPSHRRSFAGTPRYMAPEVTRGAPATPQSDLYSLALVLYELCTHELPPPLTEPSGRELPGGPEPVNARGLVLSERAPGIDVDFTALIERCLRIHPEERVPSAEALYTALKRLDTPQEQDDVGNPYRGLAPFEARHSALFFGRDDDIRGVLERLTHQSLVLVAGDSGVGKSSLCRAGILPRVKQGRLDSTRTFDLLTLEPGDRPLTALAASLVRERILPYSEAELSALLISTPARVAMELRAACQGARGLLLFVDQLEELITLENGGEAERFARVLGELSLPAGGVRVLLAVRGDFLTRLGALPGLGDAIEGALYLLRPLSPSKVRDAITGPARSRGVTFESEQLVHTLIETTARGAGSLPLLQFALAELWEHRDPVGHITQAALDAMGGVTGALSRHADAVITRLTQGEQRAARHLLRQLITPEGTRRERGEGELALTSDDARAALRALVQGRLLQTRTDGGQANYEIAHEVLITNWPTLLLWLDEDVAQRALRRRLEAASAEWKRLDQSPAYLWRERQLDEARALEPDTLGAFERTFLQASRRAAIRRKLTVGCLILLAGGIYGIPRLREQLETQYFVEQQVATYRTFLAQHQELGQQALAEREKALSLFDGMDARRDRLQLRSEAETIWKDALRKYQTVMSGFAIARQKLDDAYERVPGDPVLRQLRDDIRLQEILLFERFLEKEYDGSASSVNGLDATSQLELVLEPSDARLEVLRSVDDAAGGKQLEALFHLSPAESHSLVLVPGSYHFRMTRAGYASVEFPILMTRGRHEPLTVRLPKTVPEGFVYIPPGCTLVGANAAEEVRSMLTNAPAHTRCLQEGFLIGCTEVTLGEWMAYVNTLPRTAQERNLLADPAAGPNGIELTLRNLSDGTWRFSLFMGATDVKTQVIIAHAAKEGERIRYPRRREHVEHDWRQLPLVGVAAEDLTGYFQWLEKTRGIQGARLCDELEWTRAARGADGRSYPHGNILKTDDANVDVTYGREVASYGPDEVGSHPASNSPFGVSDMVGNAQEFTRSPAGDLGDYALLGGGWYYDPAASRIDNRLAGGANLRDAIVGVRVCAPFPVH